MDRPNLSHFKTIADTHKLINHHSKSEIFLQDSLDITALEEALTEYRKWWSEKEKRTSIRHFVFSLILTLGAAANIIWSWMTEDNTISGILSLLIILIATWNIWDVATSQGRRITRLEAEGYPYLSREEFNAWVDLMGTYVGVQGDDDNDEIWNQSVIKLNTIRGVYQ